MIRMERLKNELSNRKEMKKFSNKTTLEIVIFSIILMLVSLFIFKNTFFEASNTEGVYLKLNIQDDKFIQQKLNALMIDIRYKLDKKDIVYDDMKVINEGFSFEALDTDDFQMIDNILELYHNIFIVQNKEYDYHLTFKQSYLKRYESELLEKAYKVLEQRLEGMGLYNGIFDFLRLEKTTINMNGDEFIEIMIPPLSYGWDYDRLANQLGKQGYFEILPVKEEDNSYKHAIPILDSHLLKSVALHYSQNNEPLLGISLTEDGKRIWADYTSISLLKKIAIVIDNKLYAMPTIINGVFNGSFIINLEDLTAQELYDLSILLNSGALPVRLQVEQKRHILALE